MRLLAAAMVCAFAAGCRPAPLAFPAALNSPYPEERVRAVRMAVDYRYSSAEDRRGALEILVARLDDEDDAVRFFAIMALEKMTGTRQGYNYYAPTEERSRAIARWHRYLDRQANEVAASQPARKAGNTAQ